MNHLPMSAKRQLVYRMSRLVPHMSCAIVLGVIVSLISCSEESHLRDVPDFVYESSYGAKKESHGLSFSTMIHASLKLTPKILDTKTKENNFSYSISEGKLPGGLALNTATGEISGTPNALVSDAKFLVTATAKTGTIYKGSKKIMLKIHVSPFATFFSELKRTPLLSYTTTDEPTRSPEKIFLGNVDAPFSLMPKFFPKINAHDFTYRMTKGMLPSYFRLGYNDGATNTDVSAGHIVGIPRLNTTHNIHITIIALPKTDQAKKKYNSTSSTIRISIRKKRPSLSYTVAHASASSGLYETPTHEREKSPHDDTNVFVGIAGVPLQLLPIVTEANAEEFTFNIENDTPLPEGIRLNTNDDSTKTVFAGRISGTPSKTTGDKKTTLTITAHPKTDSAKRRYDSATTTIHLTIKTASDFATFFRYDVVYGASKEAEKIVGSIHTPLSLRPTLPQEILEDFTFENTPRFPSHLHLSWDGKITGTPKTTTDEKYTITATVKKNAHHKYTKTMFSTQVPILISNAPHINTPFTYTITEGAKKDTENNTFIATEGVHLTLAPQFAKKTESSFRFESTPILPSGLKLMPDGTITGIPQITSTPKIVVEITATSEDFSAKVPIMIVVKKNLALSLRSTYIWSTSDIKNAGTKQHILSQAIKDNALTVPAFTIEGLTPKIKYDWDFIPTKGNNASGRKRANAAGRISFAKNDIYSATSTLMEPLSKTNGEQIIRLYVQSETEAGTIFFVYKPTEIWTWQDLQAMRQNLKGHYVQKRDIAFPDVNGDGKTDYEDYNFDPIGKKIASSHNAYVHASASEDASFVGSFDGKNFKIRDLSLKSKTPYISGGLFGNVGAQDVAFTTITAHLENANIEGSTHVGGIVGTAIRAHISGSNRNGIVKGRIHTHTSVGGVGGLVGTATFSIIRGANTSSVVSHAYAAGGLVGWTKNTHIMGYNAGDVETQNEQISSLTIPFSSHGADVGGLVGWAYNASISGSNRGNLKTKGLASSDAGGLVGEAQGGKISGFHSDGEVKSLTSSAGALIGRAKPLGDVNTLPPLVHAYYNKRVLVVGKKETIVGKEIADITKTTQETFSDLPRTHWTFRNGKWPCVLFPYDIGNTDFICTQ